MTERIFTKTRVLSLLNNLKTKHPKKVIAVSLLSLFLSANSLYTRFLPIEDDSDSALRTTHYLTGHGLLRAQNPNAQKAKPPTQVTEEEKPQDNVQPKVKEKTVIMTAYTSRSEETDGDPCIAADGTNICEYKGCVVASNSFPLGTIVEVEGFGQCTVKDRMHSRYRGRHMDIYFGDDVEAAMEFGRRRVKISILS